MLLQRRDLSVPSLRIEALDGLRGVAVLIVFLSHTSNSGWHLIPYLDLRGIGKSGVYLFFALSAFQLSRALLATQEPFFSYHNISNYWIRRFTRIYPLYILYLIICISIFYFYQQNNPVGRLGIDLDQFARHLFLQEGQSVAWSIPVEFKFYVILPIIAWLIGRSYAFHWMLSLTIAVVMVIFASMAFPPAQSVGNDIRTGPYLPIFIAGSYLGVIHGLGVKPWDFVRVISPLLLALSIVALAYATPTLYGLVNGEEVPKNVAHRWFIYFALVWSLLLVSCLYGYRWISRLFEFSPLQFLGLISFSFYLWHLIIIRIVAVLLPDMPGTAKAWIAFVAAVLISTATYLLVEKPTSRIGARRGA